MVSIVVYNLYIISAPTFIFYLAFGKRRAFYITAFRLCRRSCLFPFLGEGQNLQISDFYCIYLFHQSFIIEMDGKYKIIYDFY